MRPPFAIHAVAWVCWLGAVLCALTATRNPWYLAVTVLWIAAVHLTARVAGVLDESSRRAPLSPWRFGLVVVALSAVFNMLAVHVGATVLMTLPPGWPLIGGPLTLEALVFGALNGLVLAGLFAAFVLVNQVLPIRSLIQLIPRAYYSVAVVISIGVTFAPAMVRQAQQIREAQAVRGHRLGGLRSWLPLLLPLLTGGLERALQLAEAMMARGFAGSDNAALGLGSRLALLASLLVVAAGWLAGLLAQRTWLGGGLLAAGALGLVLTLWRVGKRHPHTVYRPAPWLLRDWVVVAGALLTAAVFVLPAPGLDRSSLFYSPYPELVWPDFSAAIGAATWGLLAPAVVWMMAET